MPPRQPIRSRQRAHWPWLLLVVVIVGAATWLLYPRVASPPAATPDGVVEGLEPAAEEPAEPRYPLEPPTVAGDEERAPLPGLADSDETVLDELAGLLAQGELDTLVVREFLIPRAVASVDNLPRRSLPARLHPLRPTPGGLQVDAGDPPRLAAANARRYDRRIALMESVDVGALVDVYVRWYPHFQQAYRDLGYPGAHFNDRLVEVIDHLLEAPEVPGRPALEFKEPLYVHADPALESLSIGHRGMIRIGPEHAARVKAWLRSLRAELLSRGPAEAGAG